MEQTKAPGNHWFVEPLEHRQITQSIQLQEKILRLEQRVAELEYKIGEHAPEKRQIHH